MSAPSDHVPVKTAPIPAVTAATGLPVAEPGQSTTEFWGKTAVQIVTLGFALVTAYQGHDATTVGTAAFGIIAALEGVYAVSRSIRKKGTAG